MAAKKVVLNVKSPKGATAKITLKPATPAFRPRTNRVTQRYATAAIANNKNKA